MKTFKGFVLSTIVLALGIVTIGEASAQRNRPFPNDDFGNHQNQGKVRLEEYVQQDYFGPQTLPLRKMLRMGPEHRGYSLKKVVIIGSSARGRAQASILADGREVGFSQTLGMSQSRLVFKMNGLKVGRDFRTLKLDIRGRRIFIDRIVAVLEKKQRHQRTQIIQEFVGQDFGRFESLKVGRKLQLQAQHQGKKLQFVEIDAEAIGRHRDGWDNDFDTRIGNGRVIRNRRDMRPIPRPRPQRRLARATLLINGVPQAASQIVSTLGGRIRFDLRGMNVIGQDVRRVQIEFQGNVYVRSVSAGVKGGRDIFRPF